MNVDKPTMKKLYETIFAGVENIKMDCISTGFSADHSQVFTEFKMTFKYIKDVKYFPVKKATGKEVVMYGISSSTLKDGKVSSVRQVANIHFDGEPQ